MLNLLNKWISNTVLYLGDRINFFVENIILLNLSPWQVILDIAIVAIIFYYLLKLIKGSRASHIITGLVMVGVIYLFSRMLELFALKWLLDRFFTFLLVAIPIIFQHELRRGLEKLGQQTKFIKAKQKKEIDYIVNEVVFAAFKIKRQKEGALIVFRRKDLLKEYEETGMRIDARLSKELLISIFSKKSPLHDGAVIVHDQRIHSAAAVLPHSFDKSYTNYGTRHKAALGLTEITDAVVVAVSEEKSEVSLVKNGRIEKLNEEELSKALRKYLTDSKL